MGTKKVYDRVEYNGEQYIKLLEKETLKRLDVSWCQTKKDLQALNKLYQELMHTAQRWYWVDTGVQLRLLSTEFGFIWLVFDEEANSKRLQWLMSRARTYENKIVNRINKYASVLAEQPEKVEEVLDDGNESGEYSADQA